MKSIAPGLRSYLDAHVSTGGFPIYLNKVPQLEPNHADPFYLIQRMGRNNHPTLDDPGDDSLVDETVRITAYGRTDLIADTRADAVSTHLADFGEGAMGTDRRCEAIYVEDESSDYEPPQFVDGFDTSEVILLIQHSPAA